MPRPAKTANKIAWVQPDGKPVSCVDKLAVLNDNLDLLKQECQDVLEDAVLMGCDENQVRDVLHDLVNSAISPFKK